MVPEFVIWRFAEKRKPSCATVIKMGLDKVLHNNVSQRKKEFKNENHFVIIFFLVCKPI